MLLTIGILTFLVALAMILLCVLLRRWEAEATTTTRTMMEQVHAVEEATKERKRREECERWSRVLDERIASIADGIDELLEISPHLSTWEQTEVIGAIGSRISAARRHFPYLMGPLSEEQERILDDLSLELSELAGSRVARLIGRN